MRFDDFRALIARLAREVPEEFRAGIVAIDVSPKAVPDPVQSDVYTLGECIPLEWSGDGANLQSRVVLYHGSFAELAHDARGGFAWRQEAWDTLSHELRHHLEWRANVRALEAYDWAAQQNFARAEGRGFDPLFYRSGEKVAEGVYKVDDDVFLEREEGRGKGEGYAVPWHGRLYTVPAPAAARPPLFISLEGLAPAPAGEAVLVIPRKASLFDLVRRTAVTQRSERVEAIDG
jgi:hypothetical protein